MIELNEAARRRIDEIASFLWITTPHNVRGDKMIENAIVQVLEDPIILAAIWPPVPSNEMLSPALEKYWLDREIFITIYKIMRAAALGETKS